MTAELPELKNRDCHVPILSRLAMTENSECHRETRSGVAISEAKKQEIASPSARNDKVKAEIAFPDKPGQALFRSSQ